ncbi:MAG: hypothetical protein R3F39_17580 [Myxococcota bacterium]
MIALTGSLRLVNTTHRVLKIRLDGARLGKPRRARPGCCVTSPPDPTKSSCVVAV